MRIVLFSISSFSFCAAFTHGQNIVETCTLFGFSLFCPCSASLYLLQAALGFAPPLYKEKKRQKKTVTPSVWSR